MGKTYKTINGTELPLLNLRGKDYLEVKYRLVWFREEHPDWSIETELVSTTEKSACAKATVRDSQGRIIATSHKLETERGFPDYLEKAETGAIGRALALIGYGTQFCADELDEGERLVDSPADLSGATARAPLADDQRHAPADGAEAAAPGLRRESDPGEFVIPFGKKYRGKKVREVPRKELEGYIAWLEADAEKKKVPLSFEAKILKRAAELHHGAGAGSDEASA